MGFPATSRVTCGSSSPPPPPQDEDGLLLESGGGTRAPVIDYREGELVMISGSGDNLSSSALSVCTGSTAILEESGYGLFQ